MRGGIYDRGMRAGGACLHEKWSLKQVVCILLECILVQLLGLLRTELYYPIFYVSVFLSLLHSISLCFLFSLSISNLL